MLSKQIQSIWEEHLTKNMANKKNDQGENWVREYHERTMTCDWIKDSYGKVAQLSLNEVRNILCTSINQLEKLELLNLGIILQIFRLMINEAFLVSTGKSSAKPIWVIQVPSADKVDDKVKKISVKYYSMIENYMTNALSSQLEIKKDALINAGLDDEVNRDEEIKLLVDAYKNSHKLLRKIGKDIGLIIPVNGKNMRLTLSDDILKYFVLSMIEPSTSITLDSFLEKLYVYYGIIVREDEYIKHYKDTYGTEVYASYLIKNFDEFIIQLRNNGYLKELSDATAIVMNPYDREESDYEIY